MNFQTFSLRAQTHTICEEKQAAPGLGLGQLQRPEADRRKQEPRLLSGQLLVVPRARADEGPLYQYLYKMWAGSDKTVWVWSLYCHSSYPHRAHGPASGL